MKYLFALAVVLCLAGCATTSTITRTTSQNFTVTNYAVMPDGAVYSWKSSQ